MKKSGNYIVAKDLLWGVIDRIRDRVAQTERRAKDKLTVAQVRTFRVVVTHYPEGISLRGVANACGVTPGTASVAISGLVDLGLVQRAAVAGDRRSVRLLPTKKALVRETKFFKEEDRLVALAFSGITESECRFFEKILNKMSNNLDKE